MRISWRLQKHLKNAQEQLADFRAEHWVSLHVLRPVMLAVGAILGAFLWFSAGLNLPLEGFGPLFAAFALLLAALWLWKRPTTRFLAVGLLFFCYSGLFTLWHQHHAPDFTPTGKTHWVSGKLHDAQTVGNRSRVWLRNVTIYEAEKTTAHIPRLFLTLPASSFRKSSLKLGETFAAEATLYAPKAPQFEGDYDNRLKALFTGEIATGFVQGAVHASQHGQQVSGPWLQRLRAYFVEKLQHENGLAVALLTGVRSHIPPALTQAFRDTGLSHLLAISGLHVGMVAALVFLGLRRLFVCFSASGWQLKKQTKCLPVAARWLVRSISGKTLAALGAIALACGYMLLAGATVPTVRAFIMVCLILSGVVLRRAVQGLRLWALAVFAVLLLWPWVVITPSFQLSFAAVLALGVFYDWQNNTFSRDAIRQRFAPKQTYWRSIFTTTLVASIATFPLVLWHFGAVSVVGLVMNFVAIPLLAFWILPLGLLCIFTGFPPVLVDFLQVGTGWLASAAQKGAHMGEVWQLSQISLPLWALGPISMCGFLALWGVLRHRPVLFRLGLVGFVALPLLIPAPKLPDMVFLEYGRMVLLLDDGTYYLIHNQTKQAKPKVAARFARFHQAAYVPSPPRNWACDGDVCVFERTDATRQKPSLYTFAPHGATQEDCRTANTLFAPQAPCEEKRRWPNTQQATEVFFEK